MIRWLIAIALAGSTLLRAADVVHTERMDFPAGGTLRVNNSFGELSIEGWDQPEVEITTIKSMKLADSVTRALAQVRIEIQKQAGEVVIQTNFSRRAAAHVDLQYRIRVPRSARVIVEHKLGEVHVQEVTGDIHATTRQGEVSLQLREPGPYAIDAQTSVGSVISDFPGSVKRLRLVGHQVVETPSTPAQRIYARSGYGDILILRKQVPPTPAPLAQAAK
jgi:hypothetical protein